MNPTDPALDLGWTTVDACTLPTADRPLRLAEFDELFATLRSVERYDATRVRLVLEGGAPRADRAQALTAAESSCCSFFTFGVALLDEGLVALDIRVPTAHSDVLGGLVARAEAAGGAAA